MDWPRDEPIRTDGQRIHCDARADIKTTTAGENLLTEIHSGGEGCVRNEEARGQRERERERERER